MTRAVDPRLQELVADELKSIALALSYGDDVGAEQLTVYLHSLAQAAYDLGVASRTRLESENESLKAQVECLMQPHDATYQLGRTDQREIDARLCETLAEEWQDVADTRRIGTLLLDAGEAAEYGRCALRLRELAAAIRQGSTTGEK